MIPMDYIKQSFVRFQLEKLKGCTLEFQGLLQALQYNWSQELKATNALLRIPGLCWAEFA